MQNTGVKLNAL